MSFVPFYSLPSVAHGGELSDGVRHDAPARPARLIRRNALNVPRSSYRRCPGEAGLPTRVTGEQYSQSVIPVDYPIDHIGVLLL